MIVDDHNIDLRQDAADAMVLNFVNEFGSDNLPDLIGAILDWYVLNDMADFVRDHVLPEAVKLTDKLETPAILN